jgi:hypothetical protein
LEVTPFLLNLRAVHLTLVFSKSSSGDILINTH